MTDQLDCPAVALRVEFEQLKALSGVATEAAQKGGNSLMEHFGTLTWIREKGRSGDLVTTADHAAEAEVLNILSRSTLTSLFSPRNPSREHQADSCWCVDPLMPKQICS